MSNVGIYLVLAGVIVFLLCGLASCNRNPKGIPKDKKSKAKKLKVYEPEVPEPIPPTPRRWTVEQIRENTERAIHQEQLENQRRKEEEKAWKARRLNEFSTKTGKALCKIITDAFSGDRVPKAEQQMRNGSMFLVMNLNERLKWTEGSINRNPENLTKFTEIIKEEISKCPELGVVSRLYIHIKENPYNLMTTDDYTTADFYITIYIPHVPDPSPIDVTVEFTESTNDY